MRWLRIDINRNEHLLEVLLYASPPCILLASNQKNSNVFNLDCTIYWYIWSLVVDHVSYITVTRVCFQVHAVV